MNPFKIVPPTVRLVIYLIVFVVLAWFTALAAADGDWQQAVPLFLTALAPLLAASNVDTTKQVNG